MIVLVALVTGGSLERAIVFAVAFFVLATAYSWWSWRGKLAKRAAGGRDVRAGDGTRRDDA